VCPWWLGYWLISPLRSLLFDSGKLLATYIREGMTVVEPGPGMGFFTIEIARLVGPTGRVIAVDIQPKMLQVLKRRAAKAEVLERIDARLAEPASLGLKDLAGTVDFVLAFAVVHELPNRDAFFREASELLKPGGSLLLVEPKGHVSLDEFQAELTAAGQADLESVDRPSIRRSLAALLRKHPAPRAVRSDG
jgi:ubiquinone/menaquinone biosynthesis C-methylase UbiE